MIAEILMPPAAGHYADEYAISILFDIDEFALLRH